MVHFSTPKELVKWVHDRYWAPHLYMCNIIAKLTRNGVLDENEADEAIVWIHTSLQGAYTVHGYTVSEWRGGAAGEAAARGDVATIDMLKTSFWIELLR